jgi:DNA mismatch repair protein MutL
MNQITLLSQETIDKIAAGEVIERPASIVKELVENAIDAGANAVTVEIRDGGTSLIRITDNGSGIAKDQVQVAFLRHATSKIQTVEDLLTAGTLGFRGEALSSIAAVCQVELITKTAGSITGTRYVIEGGAEKSLEEIGAPEGTTFLVRNLFYNTPARRKFLKTPTTEAGYVSDLMERMAISHPGISFKFINNRDSRLHTSGNCNLKDIIYGIYGREIAANVVKIDTQSEHIRIHGFIGKPVISRGNRNYENYFVNGRYVKSSIIARAIEDAYKPFLMNHRYPFTALMIEVNTEEVDVNVHPTKMEVRFANQAEVYEQVLQAVKDGLAGRELIPEFTVDAPKRRETTGPQNMPEREDRLGEVDRADRTHPDKQADAAPHGMEHRDVSGSEKKTARPFTYPEPFEKIRSQLIAEANSPYEKKYPRRESSFRPVTGNIRNGEVIRAEQSDRSEKLSQTEAEAKSVPPVASPEPEPFRKLPEHVTEEVRQTLETEIQAGQQKQSERPVQMELFEDKLLDQKSRHRHKLIGQVFDTYWIVEFDEKLFIIDQHAAHEKVLYERMMEKLRTKTQTSQMITPPIIVTLNLQEETLLKQNMDHFTAIGFEIAHFGGKDYAISAVPDNLYGIAGRTLFTEILDGLSDVSEKMSSQTILEKIASMSCKAAVKGNNALSVQEADALIEELLGLENPYNCPHGRPTIIEMTKYELEKKFKRII